MLPPKPDWQTPVQSITPNNKGDSGLGSSIDATAPGYTSTESNHNRDANPLETTLMVVAPVGENDPFVVEVATIMEDMELSMQRYVQEVMNTLLLHYYITGGMGRPSRCCYILPYISNHHFAHPPLLKPLDHIFFACNL